jgi:transcriptional regulator with PAS, ATPase and Fis domain
MPGQTQVKLLRFLEEGRFRRVGSTRDREADVRVIAATNRNLAEDVTAGRFRADLFYRLNVISLHVPPLRQRREDIPALTEHFLSLFRERFNRPALDLSPEARQRLNAYDWPGNVRELRNALERAVALASADSDLIEADQLLPSHTPQHTGGDTDISNPTPLTLDQLERRHILRVLEEQAGNRERAAAVLGISARTLYRKLREYEH